MTPAGAGAVDPGGVQFVGVQLVGIGGAIGALARLALTRLAGAGRYPLGTVAVNVLGSFALGLLTALSPGGEYVLFFGTGVCGAFTTFSSFAYETVRLWETGDRVLAAVHAVGNLVLSLGALALAAVVAGPQ